VTQPEPTDLGRALSSAVIGFHQAVADMVGLSAADHKALEAIAREGPMRAREVSALVGLTPSATTALIDRLEEAGYARREPDPNDRRSTLITATLDDHHEIGAAHRRLARSMQRFMGTFSLDEQLVIHRYVTGTIDVLSRETRRLRQ
jgi:DNA-binding MarR family transcriptional regulator